MKRIHYLLLGLLVSLTIAATGPGLPPTRIAPGTNTTVVTNGVNSFTISSSAGGSGAQLDGTNVFTGTNTFPAASFYQANNIGMRLLYSTTTNTPITSVVVNALANLTNNGDFVNTTPVISGVTVPALLGSNSLVLISTTSLRSNANSSTATAYFYAGTNTNFMATSASFIAATLGQSVIPLNVALFQNAASFQNQITGSGGTVFLPGINPLVDTSAPWLFYLGLSTVTSHTNVNVISVKLYELYAP